METGKAKTEAPAAVAPVPKSKLKKPSLKFNAIFKKPNKNAKTDAEQAAQQAGDATPAAPRDSEETVVITDELPEKKVSTVVIDSYWSCASPSESKS